MPLCICFSQFDTLWNKRRRNCSTYCVRTTRHRLKDINTGFVHSGRAWVFSFTQPLRSYSRMDLFWVRFGVKVRVRVRVMIRVSVGVPKAFGNKQLQVCHYISYFLSFTLGCWFMINLFCIKLKTLSRVGRFVKRVKSKLEVKTAKVVFYG